jgi:hypothetical protein
MKCCRAGHAIGQLIGQRWWRRGTGRVSTHAALLIVFSQRIPRVRLHSDAFNLSMIAETANLATALAVKRNCRSCQPARWLLRVPQRGAATII